MNSIVKVVDAETHLAHVEGHDVRMAFLDRLTYCYLDPDFRDLVEKQLSLYCGSPDPRIFVAVCNDPKHVIRNRMIAFEIDHPEMKVK